MAHDSGEQALVLYQDFVEDAGNARGCEQKAARRLSSAAAPVKGTLGRSISRAARRRHRSTLSVPTSNLNTPVLFVHQGFVDLIARYS